LTVNGTTFENHISCLSGGAITNDRNSDANLVDCRFIANSVRDRGGAIENVYGSTLALTRCLFLQNTASYLGGAVLCTDAKMTLNQCRFNGNTATFLGGALYNNTSETFNITPEVKVVNCAFSGNEASSLGGAIANEKAELTIVNSTFWANKAAAGAAIGSDSLNPPTTQSSVSVFNSILWDGALQEIAGKDGSDPIVAYTDIYDPSGGWTVWPGLHNLIEDPRFVDANGPDGVVGTEDDNLRLAVGSPCIDAGDNGRVFPETVVDLDGRKRFVDDPDTVDKGTGTAPIVDMGAMNTSSGCPVQPSRSRTPVRTRRSLPGWTTWPA